MNHSFSLKCEKVFRSMVVTVQLLNECLALVREKRMLHRAAVTVLLFLLYFVNPITGDRLILDGLSLSTTGDCPFTLDHQ